MRDIKAIEELVPEWAKGCGKCTCGIVSAPPVTRAADLCVERLVQAIDKQVVFCSCQAGARYRVYLLNCRQKLIEEARKDPRMAQAAAKLTHPDIEIARGHIYDAYEMAQPPAMHYEGVTA